MLEVLYPRMCSDHAVTREDMSTFSSEGEQTALFGGRADFGMGTREIVYSTLERATTDVIRGFSGLPVQPADDVIPLPGEECVVGRAHFGAAMAGLITVAAPVGLCRRIAIGGVGNCDSSATIMACASQTIAALTADIAGYVLVALLPELAITLSPPVTERSSYHDWVVMSCAGGTVRLRVAGYPLLSSVTLPSS